MTNREKMFEKILKTNYKEEFIFFCGIIIRMILIGIVYAGIMSFLGFIF